MYHSHASPALVRAPLKGLRPTQLTVGYAEVEKKARQWARLGKKQRKMEIDRHVFPAVVGAGQVHYITDHHHLGIALLETGVEEVSLAVLDDLSWLEPAVFWRMMEFRSWSHPYDNRGRRRDYREMPRRLTQLQNDPYRSLAAEVRSAGGFAKEQEPYVEFLWADFFRPRINARLIKSDPQRALRDGLREARSKQARYLPGFSGPASA
ncbi:MAG: ParB/Srx family N-terminal domain-containing protein [Pseudomonadota bacterium]|nr:ParB/Srx family N-terminal domain-containing protein [Pseudomonadota bacterium]